MKKTTHVIAFLLALAAPASAQWQEFPGGILTRSTANDSVTHLGGVVIGVLANPSVQELDVRSATDGLAGGIRVSRTDASYLILNMDDSTAYATIQAGDGSGFLPIRINPNGGQVHFVPGTTGAPGVSSAGDTNTGINFNGGDNIAIVTGGRNSLSVNPNFVEMVIGDFGTGTGTQFIAGRNTNATTPAAGSITFIESDNGASAVWADSTGVLRVHTAPPSSAGGVADTAGTVIGTQTSTRASKLIDGQVSDTAAAMALINATPVYQFRYRDGRYNGETFFGIVTDDSPLFGMDGGKSFNPVTAFGATVLALRDLDARLRALEGR